MPIAAKRLSTLSTFGDLTVVSGGQTGVDRQALDWALARGVCTAGFLPADGLAEDGPVDPRYGLRCLPHAGYRERTRANVELAQATLILSSDAVLSGGSLLTLEYASRVGRPTLHLHPGLNWQALFRAQSQVLGAHVLNVAGPRASGGALAEEFCTAVLDAWLAHHTDAESTLSHPLMQADVIDALVASIVRFDALYEALAQ